MAVVSYGQGSPLGPDDQGALRLIPTHRDSTAAYIGVIGSRGKVTLVYWQLLAEGISRERLEHIHAPVGLNLGAKTPEEIA